MAEIVETDIRFRVVWRDGDGRIRCDGEATKWKTAWKHLQGRLKGGDYGIDGWIERAVVVKVWERIPEESPNLGAYG